MQTRRGKKGLDLFEAAARERADREAPLAARMRPSTFDEFVGQEHLVGETRMLRRLIESDQLPSLILWGPPGSGKTTLARVVAAHTRSHFEPISAVTAGVADLRRLVAEARDRRALNQQRTIVFIDEIHRFNKAQQDVVLPHVEDGTVTLIGATTENPSFEVIGPLLSRSRVYTLNFLTPEHIETILRRALSDSEHGLGSERIDAPDDVVAALAASTGGDARIALNALELAVSAILPDEQGVKHLTLELVEEALQHRTYLYDRAGDAHYDTISAFIKSVRDSDADAALYWLARMIEAGEDPLFIVRRLVILAAEDVGLADPQALVVAVACQQAVHFIGMPEGYLPMAECVIYLATAPKSNSALTAYGRAAADARETRNDPVPLHLRNAATGLMRELGYGREYKYAHSFPEHQVEQEHLPERLKGRRYYEPGELGWEKRIRETYDRLRAKGKGQEEAEPGEKP